MASIADMQALDDLLDSLPDLQRASIERALEARYGNGEEGPWIAASPSAIQQAYGNGYRAGKKAGIAEVTEDGKQRAARSVNRAD